MHDCDQYAVYKCNEIVQPLSSCCGERTVKGCGRYLCQEHSFDILEASNVEDSMAHCADCHSEYLSLKRSNLCKCTIIFFSILTCVALIAMGVIQGTRKTPDLGQEYTGKLVQNATGYYIAPREGKYTFVDASGNK